MSNPNLTFATIEPVSSAFKVAIHLYCASAFLNGDIHKPIYKNLEQIKQQGCLNIPSIRIYFEDLEWLRSGSPGCIYIDTLSENSTNLPDTQPEGTLWLCFYEEMFFFVLENTEILVRVTDPEEIIQLICAPGGGIYHKGKLHKGTKKLFLKLSLMLE